MVSGTMRNTYPGTSLTVQWLRLHAPNSGGTGLFPDQGIQIPPNTTKSSHTATKDPTQCMEMEDPLCHN